MNTVNICRGQPLSLYTHFHSSLSAQGLCKHLFPSLFHLFFIITLSFPTVCTYVAIFPTLTQSLLRLYPFKLLLPFFAPPFNKTTLKLSVVTVYFILFCSLLNSLQSGFYLYHSFEGALDKFTNNLHVPKSYTQFSVLILLTHELHLT